MNLIQIQKYSATAAGTAFLPFILILFVMSRWSGGLTNQFGPKIPLMVGPAIAAGGFILFAVPEVNDNYWLSFFPAVVILGFGMAVRVAPLTTTVMNSVPENQSGIASGINNAVSRTAALLVLAVFGIVMVQSFNKDLDLRLEALRISDQEERLIEDQRTRLAGIELSSVSDISRRETLRSAVIQSFVSSFRKIILLAAVLAAASSVFLFSDLWLPPNKLL